MGRIGVIKVIISIVILFFLISPALISYKGRDHIEPTSNPVMEYNCEKAVENPIFQEGFLQIQLSQDNVTGFTTSTDFGNAGFHRRGINYEILGKDREIIQLQFIGSNEVQPTGIYRRDTSITVISIKGNSEIHTFASIIYQDLWNNIDLKFYKVDKVLKYDLIVRPGGDHRDIRIKVIGHRDLKIVDDAISIVTDNGYEIRDEGLNIFYSDDSSQILGRIGRSSLDSYTFVIDDVDHTREYVIDPFIFSSIVGSLDGKKSGSSHQTKYDRGNDMILDGQDNIYITGFTNSLKFPVIAGEMIGGSELTGQDIFITKISANGSRILFSTIIIGSDDDWGNSVELDTHGRIWIMGGTNSDDLPITDDAMDVTTRGGGFILCLDVDGKNLLYLSYIGKYGGLSVIDSTLLSGEKMAIYGGSEEELEIEPSENTYNNTKEEINGTFIFIGIFDIEMRAMTRMTFIGGDKEVYAGKILEGRDGEICISGWTRCHDFPLNETENRIGEKGSVSAFLLKMDGSLSSIISSIVIQTGWRYGLGIDPVILEMDSSGYFYLGSTTGDLSLDAENQNYFDPNPYRDYVINEHNIFLLKVDPTGTNIVGSLLFGSSENDELRDLVIDGSGGLFVTGYSKSSETYLTESAIDQGYDRGSAILLIFDDDLDDLHYSGRFGAGGADKGNDIELDSKGHIVIMGETESEDFFITSNGFGVAPDAFYFETFVVKLNLEPYERIHEPAIGSLTLEPEGVMIRWEISPLYSEKTIYFEILREYRRSDYTMEGVLLRSDIGADHFIDSDLVEGRTYRYRIRAIVDNTPSNFSEKLEIKVDYLPSEPVNLRVRSNDPNEVFLTWKEPIITFDIPISRYIIYRNDLNDDWSHLEIIGEVGGDIFTYTDENGSVSERYEYSVRASNEYGDGGYSETKSVEVEDEFEITIFIWIAGSICTVITIALIVVAILALLVRRKKKN